MSFKLGAQIFCIYTKVFYVKSYQKLSKVIKNYQEWSNCQNRVGGGELVRGENWVGGGEGGWGGEGEGGWGGEGGGRWWGGKVVGKIEGGRGKDEHYRCTAIHYHCTDVHYWFPDVH